MRTYDGHGTETASETRQAERLPCCVESPNGVCEQHLDQHMTKLVYDHGVEFGWGGYREARNRAAARLSREMGKPAA